MKTKRYLVFRESHEPAGGWADLEGSYSKLKDAIEVAEASSPGYARVYIIDLNTGEHIKTISYERY